MANYDIPQYPTKRLRYFNNQFLSDQDFIDDDAVQIGHERAFLRSLCVAGVCEGLQVTYPTANLPPSVSAGVAIDKTGRMIVIDHATDALARPDALADGDYFIHISFLEIEDVKASGQGASDFTRWKQTPVINATAKSAALPDGVVVLGGCTVKNNVFVGTGTTAGRQYSGLRLPGPNQGAAATLRNNGAADDLAVLAGSLTIRRDVSAQLGPTLTLLNGSCTTGAGGAIDFNSYDPGSNDPALRMRSLDDGDWSDHLTFSTKQPGANAHKLVERLRLTSTGNLGIGTPDPKDILHVLHADTVGLLESSTTQAALHLATSEGTGNYVGFANRSGGNAAISVGTAGDALIVKKDGGVVVSKASGGVGDLTVENCLRFPNEAKDRIILYDGFGMGLSNSNINLFYLPTAHFSLRQNSSSGTEVFSVDGSGKVTLSGPIVPKVGNDPSSGIYFPTNPGGGTGDEAFLRYYVTSGEDMKLMLGINNDPDDTLGLWQAGAERLTVSNGNVGVGTKTPQFALDVAGIVQANGFRGRYDLVLDDYRTVNPSSNTCLQSPANDRDAWIYRDPAGTTSNWGIYHRQIDTAVANLPGNSIGFVGNTALQAYIALGDGSAYFAGRLGIGTTAPEASLHVTNGSRFSGGRHYFTDEEGSNRLRVGTAWKVPGLYSEDSQDIVVGCASGKKVHLGQLNTVTVLNGDITISGNLGSHGYGPNQLPSWMAGGVTTYDVVAYGSGYAKGGFHTQSLDLAERFAYHEVGLEPGDVLAVDPHSPERLIRSRSAQQDDLVGVVSERPGFVLGVAWEDPEVGLPLALAGRVPVKVNLEGGPIRIGDYLTSSSQPGVAMRTVRSGRVLGLAMQAFDGTSGDEGKVVVFVNPHWFGGR